MQADPEKILGQFFEEIARAETRQEAEKLRIKYLGRRGGILPKLTKEIPSLPILQRAGLGTKIREVRDKIEKTLENRLKNLTEDTKETPIDVTTPGEKPETGSLHPLTQVIEEVKEIFHYLGFGWTDGPEVETDVYNFQKLNIPPDHPARDIQQTYYLDESRLLRTHTSNMQIRFLEKHGAPTKMLFPGRCYRRDMPDATHLPSFYQIEGLLVDKTANMRQLLGSLDFFAKAFFGEKTKIRVYGHYFPYTEPSIEVEVLRPEKGWVEILGAGMVHPNVLKNANVDPDKYRGWAFGMGPDRLAMIKFGIEDIRVLYKGEIQMLKQF